MNDSDTYKRIFEQEEDLLKKLDEFMEQTNQQWIESFRKQDLLHLNEPLLRKEDNYYLVNIKPEVKHSIDSIF